MDDGLCQNVQVCTANLIFMQLHRICSVSVFLQCPSRTLSAQRDPVWLVPYLNCHDTVDRRHLDSALSQFQQLKDHFKYKYLLVMPWCGRNLDDIIDKECATIDIKKTIVALVKAVK